MARRWNWPAEDKGNWRGNRLPPIGPVSLYLVRDMTTQSLRVDRRPTPGKALDSTLAPPESRTAPASPYRERPGWRHRGRLCDFGPPKISELRLDKRRKGCFENYNRMTAGKACFPNGGDQAIKWICPPHLKPAALSPRLFCFQRSTTNSASPPRALFSRHATHGLARLRAKN